MMLPCCYAEHAVLALLQSYACTCILPCTDYYVMTEAYNNKHIQI